MALKLLGVVAMLTLGVVGGYFARPTLERWTTGRGQVEATIVEERREQDRLVLSLRSQDRAMMATFRERADDIAALVEIGDVVTLRVSGQNVFADDVPILNVRRRPPPSSRRRRRGEDAEAEPTAATAGPEAPSPAEHEEGAETGTGSAEPGASSHPAAPEEVAPGSPAPAPTPSEPSLQRS